MSDSRSRPVRRSTSARNGTVGGKGKSPPLLFIGGIVAVVFAFVVLITVAADAFGGDSPPANPGTLPGETETPGATADNGATDTPGGTQRPDEATPTATPDSSGAIQVTCGDLLAPVDKQHRLASNCVPPGLEQIPAEFASGYQSIRGDALPSLLEMFQAAKAEGFALYVNSSYRNFQEQEYTYNYWVSQNGKEYADRTSARPGHSEHQMGSTADVGWNGCELECTQGTPEAAWIAANSYKYGFIVSYPDGKEHITGYAYEPWHIRYVGRDVARQVHESGLTLHEFLLR